MLFWRGNERLQQKVLTVEPENDNKTRDKQEALQIDSTDNQDSHCLDKSDTVQISYSNKNDNAGNKELVKQFEIGQLVKLQLSNFNGVSETLRLANHSYGQVTALTENQCSFNVKIFGNKSFVVSPQDIQPVNSVSFCVEFSPKQFIALMSIYQSRNEIENAIKKGVLN